MTNLLSSRTMRGGLLLVRRRERSVAISSSFVIARHEAISPLANICHREPAKRSPRWLMFVIARHEAISPLADIRHREARSDLPAGKQGDCVSRWRSFTMTNSPGHRIPLRAQVEPCRSPSCSSSRGTKRSPRWYTGRLRQSLALLRNDESPVIAYDAGRSPPRSSSRAQRGDLPAGIQGDCFSRWRSFAMTNLLSSRTMRGDLLLVRHRERSVAISPLVYREIASVAGAPSQ